jgi:hypothetical protein
MINDLYLPFTKEELASHFYGDYEKWVEYFQNSASNYKEYQQNVDSLSPVKIADCKTPRQIEKDERFWTITTLKKLFDKPDRKILFSNLLADAFGYKPPVNTLNTWDECLSGNLQLFFEADLPSPKQYSVWLHQNINQRHFIKYVLESSLHSVKRGLEGPTQVDAILINPDNGFAVIFEAKVLSDISKDITFDIFRNQIIRNIDVMLESNEKHTNPHLQKRDPEKTLFSLLTPDYFKKNKRSRLYGWLFESYKFDSSMIQQDLPHRKDLDCLNISERMGWMTFEDCFKAIQEEIPFYK